MAESASKKVLLAEDNRLNALVASRFLQSLGFSVERVSNGSEAVNAWAAGGFCAVLMDVSMPVMSGLEAARTIRDREREAQAVAIKKAPMSHNDQASPSSSPVPLFAITAHRGDAIEADCDAAGFTAIVPKPLSKDGLRQALQSVEHGLQADGT